ncbi:hypothetical protein RRF57_000493 [Xylaria bambusicola]|uniref:Uncharacterized protein n=1 Tax=Xylaria bambusicola TaxID=326684 RepID=A0AAN7UC92_9PEZI
MDTTGIPGLEVLTLDVLCASTGTTVWTAIAMTWPPAVPAAIGRGTVSVTVFAPRRPHASHSCMYVVIGTACAAVSVAQYSMVISSAASVGHIVTNATVVVVVAALPVPFFEVPPIAGAGGGMYSLTLP